MKEQSPANNTKEAKVTYVTGTPHQHVKSGVQGRRAGILQTEEKRDLSEWEGRNKSSYAQKEQKAISPLFLLSVAAFGLLSVGVFLFFWEPPNKENIQQASQASPASSNSYALSSEPPQTTLYDIPPHKVAERFALTEDIAERLRWARSPEEIQTRLNDYPHDARITKATSVKELGLITTNGDTYASFVATLPDGGRRFRLGHLRPLRHS